MPEAAPLAWPVTPGMVREFTDLAADAATDYSLTKAVDAVNAYVPSLEQLAGFYVEAEEEEDPPVFTPPKDVILGAVLLASRWHARRGTQLGTMGYGEFGTETILIQDPDIRRLLRLGPLGAFVFGAPSLPVEDEEVVV